MRLVLDSLDGVLKVLTPAEAKRAERRRQALEAALGPRLQRGFKGSKPHLGPLSPGCQRCGRGEWSCLFVSAACDARCFFCPGCTAPLATPAHAERVVFQRPESYAEYVATLGFRGVSFSGGEPFLVHDRMLDFTRALRQRLGAELYLWAYTNGRVPTVEQLRALVRAGLDELRFNIVATGYDLEPVRAAVGEVARVSVEIPAIPEDAQRLRALLPELEAAGVDHLHLHQLMVMGDNLPALQERGYTFLPTASPSVFESELSALETMKFAVEAGLGLPIQYCSYAFKERWQGRVEDLRATPLVKRGWECLVETGLTRELSFGLDDAGGAAALAALQRGEGEADGRWQLVAEERRVDLHPGEIEPLPAPLDRFAACYFKRVVGEPAPPDFDMEGVDHTHISLPGGQRIGVRRFPVSRPLRLTRAEALLLAAGEVPERLRAWELIADGLPAYR